MVFCFGEILLRMSPVLGRGWIRDNVMPVNIGGAELNVASALSKWNVPVKYGSALPDNYLSKEIIEEIQEKNIDASAIHLSGSRIGTYYLPQGADLRNTGVIYDRAHSSFAGLKPGLINWDEALNGCRWFHFSAINPALNEDVAAVCKEALEVATAKGLTISVDLNYRAKLWQYNKRPIDIMPDLVQYCQVIMGNLWAVESLLGIVSPLKQSADKTKDELIQATGESMLQLHKQYPNATSFAYTFRLEKEYWAIMQHGPEMVISQKFVIREAIDTVGSGDCFMAGLIYGNLYKLPPQEIIDFATAAAFSKLFIKGDATTASVEEIKHSYLNYA
ncbi:MAG: PfkB family carbohydrate kinase [Chitinophagaceae bacterium]